MCAALAAASAYGQTAGSGLGQVVDRPEVNPASAEEAGGAPASLESLELERKVAQLMLVTLGGVYRPNNDDRILLKEYPPGGVVIPKVAGPGDAAEYIRELRGMPGERVQGIPLLIATNAYALTQHNLLPDRAFVQLPSMLSVAAAGDSESSRRLAALVAGYMGTMGFNMHLGPSLILASTLSEAEGTVHLFGSDPEFAARAGGMVFATLAEHGILRVPMGFPGGGANRVDGGPAVLLTPRPLLKGQELLPYAAAIEAGVEIIHVGNTLVPTLDPEGGPASLSPVVIREILRGELGFEGIVMSGPVDAREMVGRYRPAEAAARALEAGADLVYWRGSGRRVAEAVSRIAAAVRRGEIDEALVDGAFERVLAFKRDHGLLERKLPDVKNAQALTKKRKSFDDAYLVERRAVTLVQNRDDFLPLAKERSMPIGVTGIVGVEELQEALEEHIKPVALQPIATARHAGRIHDFEVDRLARNALGMRTAICIFTNDTKPRGQVNLIRAFHAIGARVVVVLVGYPNLLPHFREADAIVLAYCPPTLVEQTMRAVADILMGKGPLEVLPAFRDLSKRLGEDVVFDALQVLRTPVGRLPCAIDEHFETGFSVAYDPSQAVDRVEWDFGDGKRSKGVQAVHAYSEPGRYGVTLTVTDAAGETVSGTFHVVVEGAGETAR